jgi:hypothetical protein
MTKLPADRFSLQIRASMDALLQCHRVCLSMAMTHCFEIGGEHARPQHLRLMLDCAEFCLLTADMLARKSQFHNRICALSAEICDVCAADCAKLGHMDGCVAICRTTAALCREAARLEHAEVLSMASSLPPGK